MARPSEYNKIKAAKICEQLAMGKSLRTVCEDEEMPSVFTVYYWMGKYPEFSEQYARAKQDGAEAWAEEILDIADDGSNDWMSANDPENPGYKQNGEAIQRARLRVDSRKWLLSKLLPKKYGDKLDVNQTGTMTVEQIQRVIVDPQNVRKSSIGENE